MIVPVVLLSSARQNLSTTAKTQVAVLCGASLRRFRVAGFTLGAADVPNATDCNIEYGVSRLTADGTGTALTTQFVEGLETGTQVVPTETMKGGYTAEPTYPTSASAAAVYNSSMNQRGRAEWAAIDDKAEYAAPAVQNSGFGLWALSPNYASKLAATLNFRV